MTEEDNLNRATVFFLLGMIDTYDYVVGDHPGFPDDKRPIKEWAHELKKVLASGK